MKKKETVVIDINLTRGLAAFLALALLIVAGAGYLAWGRSEAAASGSPAPLASSAGMRQYYLTDDVYDGGEAGGSDVCAAGYHFASFWEIVDPSNLKYNIALGYNCDDSGQGPPSHIEGWIRTGYYNSTSNTAGRGNCATWTSSDGADSGTTIQLPYDWEAATDIHVWYTGDPICSADRRVWCVED